MPWEPDRAVFAIGRHNAGIVALIDARSLAGEQAGDGY